MNEISETRIFWEDNEVCFIKWTNEGLAFNWDDPRETAINMPRGTVRRLMKKGVLRIEGDKPEWTQYASEAEARAAARRREMAGRPQLSDEQTSQRVGILARLIRKLSAEPTPSVQPLSAARTASAGPDSGR